MKRKDVFNKLARSSRVSYIHETDNGHEFGIKKATILYDGYKAIKIKHIILSEEKLSIFYGDGKKFDYSLSQNYVYNIEEFILTSLVVS